MMPRRAHTCAAPRPVVGPIPRRAPSEPPRLQILNPAARDGHRDREIYGWQLMTHQERSEFLAQPDTARAPEDRQSLRLRNHKAMDARARERGIALYTRSRANEDSRLHTAPARRHTAA